MKRSLSSGPPERLAASRRPVVRSGGPTASVTTNYLFAIRVADRVLELQPSFVRGKMTVFGFTPVSRPPEAHGIFIVEIDRHGKRISISVTFPTGPAIERRTFEALSSYEPGRRPARAEVHAASPDEAWLVVCEIGQMMEVTCVSLEYGGYDF